MSGNQLRDLTPTLNRIQELNAENKRLKAQNKILLKALRFYTKIRVVLSWGYEEDQDAGMVARDAIKAVKQLESKAPQPPSEPAG